MINDLHVAIIMDGNGRWALQRGRPRSFGHRQGASAVRRTVEAAVCLPVGTLTLYAFSSDNWQRPQGEVSALMDLLQRYLRSEGRRCVEQSVRLNVIGRRDRVSAALLEAIESCERQTAQGQGLLLRIAVDYSARHSIEQAAALRRQGRGGADFASALAHASNSPEFAAPVDLLIRTGGEKRLSDFLLWESAYAELHFTDCLWPDFSQAHLQAALDDYKLRQRRFGSIDCAPREARR